MISLIPVDSVKPYKKTKDKNYNNNCFMTRPHKKIILFASSIILNLYVSAVVLKGNFFGLLPNHNFLILVWLLSLIFLIFSSVGSVNLTRIKFSKRSIATIFIVLLPAIIRIANYNLNRIHGDDLIAAYFSAHFDFSKFSFFSWIPQKPMFWVAQFPTPFFVLQKIFFLIFGESLLTVKLSVIPYVVVVSLMLFLTTKTLFDKKTAFIAVIFYSIMAVSLYLETLGLHFISSTAVFMIFFYFAVLNFRRPSPLNSVLVGLSGGFCYLFYTSSYIALPILISSIFIQLLSNKGKLTAYNLVLIAISFAMVTGPFISYSLEFKNFYFLQRINQVSLLTGEWSGQREEIEKGENFLPIAYNNFLLSLQSLYKDGVGGHGGYKFGNLAMFDRLSFYLFITGIAAALILSFRKIEIFLILLTVLVSFFAGTAMTIPPPAYHRFSLAFPFIAILSSLPLYLLLSIKRIGTTLKYLITAILLAVFAINNQGYFTKATLAENDNQSLKLISYINKNFPNRNLYIASFPGFAFEKIFYFSLKKKVKNIKTSYHNDLLNEFSPNEKYIYVIIFPDIFNNKFKEKDKNGKIINFSREYSLFIN